MRVVMMCALLPACSLYFGGDDNAPPPGGDEGRPSTYELITTKTMAGEHRIVGVDSDHAGGIWIAYEELLANDLTITHLDATDTKLSEWNYTDDPSEVSGVAFSGDGVWVNYGAVGSIGANRVRKLDPATGTTLLSFATPDQISDLEMKAGELLLSSAQNQVFAIDPTTGGVVWQMVTQVVPSTQKGIATYGSDVFVSSWDMDTLTLMDDSGDILGTGTTPLIQRNITAAVGLYLASDGDGLIYASESQVAWLTVSPRI